PGAHVGAGLEPLARRPCLQQGFLDEVVGEITAARQRAAESAQMGNDLSQLVLELVVGERGPVAAVPFDLVHLRRHFARHQAAPKPFMLPIVDPRRTAPPLTEDRNQCQINNTTMNATTTNPRPQPRM